ncbi:hypothetical protein PRUB_a2936 [Pseudoalteromonas rubra]|uniref:Uncharacterized protein n=1 Tax=Pseudoalteromonas rubra TaxID=43658 RepID=A0A8T0CC82_9GAMM|nr:oligosaccharide flippase family protein [Pseudoalteromonas rubra]KAF7788309.1 hypothetical protein PRUB_a2936 [Pseudoalteromonas rubra]
MVLLKAVFNIGASRLISAFIAFLISMVIMSKLSVESFGHFYFYLSIITLATTLPAIGINNSYVFNSDKSLESQFISLKLVMTLVYSLASYLLYLLGLISDTLVLVCLCTGFLFSFFDSHLSNFQCKKKFKSYAIQLPIKNLFILSIAIFFLSYFENAIYIYSLISIVIFFGLIFYYLKSFTWNLDLKKFQLMAGGFYFFEISSLIMIRSETWWLKYFTESGAINADSLGIFGAAFTVCTVVSIASTAINSALLPFIKKDHTLLSVKNIFFFSIAAVLFLSVYYFALYFVVEIFFKEKFQDSLTYVPLILLGMLFSFLAGIIRLDLIRRELLSYLNKVYIAQLLLTIIAGCILIYLYGIKGAVIVFFGVRLIGFILIAIKYDFKTHKTFS